MVIFIGLPSSLWSFKARRDYWRRVDSSSSGAAATFGLIEVKLMLLMLLRNGLVLDDTDFSFILELIVDFNKLIDITDFRVF